MSLEQALNQSMSEIPECVAAGYVDMGAGVLLAVRTVESHPSQILDMVAEATVNLFQGPSISEIERLFRRSRGVPENDTHYLDEVVASSDNLLHVFIRGRRNHDHALVYVCRRAANVGMVLTKSRLSQSRIEASL